MTTPVHVIYNLALLGSGREKSPREMWAIGTGAFAPDVFVFVFFLYTNFLTALSFETIWSDLYFNSFWNVFFTLGHSFILLPILGLGAYYLGRKAIALFFGNAFFHAILDFFTHAEDAYAHFYPLSSWKFQSPISYWDPQYYGEYVGLASTVVALYGRVEKRFWKIIIVGAGVVLAALSIFPFFSFFV
jgi:hypothetical protein